MTTRLGDRVLIDYLADHPEALPILVEWFRTEWADYYGPHGPGNAQCDLTAYSNREELPVGLIAFYEGDVVGFGALKPESITSHRHLSPWAAAGLVLREHRRQGIGARLLSALENVARDFGYTTIYCATSSTIGLLVRNGWQHRECVRHNGEELSVYQKRL